MTATPSDPIPTPLVSTSRLSAHLDDPRLRILDASTRLGLDPETGEIQASSGEEDWARSHIPGSGFVDLRKLTDSAQPGLFMLPPASEFAEAMSALGVGPETHVVAYDNGPAMYATRLWWALRVFGFDRVSVLDGGLQAWAREGLPTSDEPCRYPPAEFEASFRPELSATLEEVEGHVSSGQACLINALSPEAFRGEGAIGYRRPGRIPSSVNVPYYGLLDSTGHFLPPEQLRDELREAGLLDADRSLVTYCGGGLAATTVAFGLALAGREDVAVYDGSLNEWTSDPDRPVEVG